MRLCVELTLCKNVQKLFDKKKILQNIIKEMAWLFLSTIFKVIQIRVISRAGLFGSGSGLKLTKISGLIRALDVLFVLGAQYIIKIT